MLFLKVVVETPENEIGIHAEALCDHFTVNRHVNFAPPPALHFARMVLKFFIVELVNKLQYRAI
jgi:hypothetical protein